MTWYVIISLLLSLIVVLYLYNRKPDVAKIFRAAYIDAHYETNSVKVSLTRGMNSITHIQPFDQLNKHDIHNLVIEYEKMSEPVTSLMFMVGYSIKFDSISLLKYSQE